MPRPGRNGVTPKRLVSTRSPRGHIDPNLEAFGQIGPNHYQLYLYDESFTEEGIEGPQPISEESGPNIRLVVVRKLQLELTNMTHEELKALRAFVNRAIDIAEPVVLARDKEAQDAYESGLDTLARLHRAVPNVVVRQRAERAHGEVLRLGPQAVADLGLDGLDRLIGGRGPGSKVADREQQDPRSEDDGSQTD